MECPECKEPCSTAERAAYGKCEDCYNRVSDTAPFLAEPARVPIGVRTTLRGGQCGGGRRVSHQSYNEDPGHD